MARVLAERRALLEKLQGIEVVEDAVREMVVQMKVRGMLSTARTTPDKPQEQQQRCYSRASSQTSLEVGCVAPALVLQPRVGFDEAPTPEQLQVGRRAGTLAVIAGYCMRGK